MLSFRTMVLNFHHPNLQTLLENGVSHLQQPSRIIRSQMEKLKTL